MQFGDPNAKRSAPQVDTTSQYRKFGSRLEPDGPRESESLCDHPRSRLLRAAIGRYATPPANRSANLLSARRAFHG